MKSDRMIFATTPVQLLITIKESVEMGKLIPSILIA